MSLALTLRSRMSEERGAQTRLAMEWLSRWQASHEGQRWSTAQVEASLSRLMNPSAAEHAKGVRFFFGDRRAAALLLDLLEVAAEDRAAVFSLADETLARAGTPPEPRVAVDLSAFDGDDEGSVGLFAAVETWLLAPPTVAPVLLVVNGTQAGVVPRRFDTLRARRLLDWRQVEGAAGAARMQEHDRLVDEEERRRRDDD